MNHHVAIDAFRLVGEPTSIGTYTIELAVALAEEGCRITLLIPRQERGGMLDALLAMLPGLRVLSPTRESQPEESTWDLYRWNQCTIPALLKATDCDCLISTYHQTPLRLPKRIPRVAVIHDCCGLREDCGYRFPGRAWLRHRVNLQSASLAAECIVPISLHTREDYLRIFPGAGNRLAAPIYNKVSSVTLAPAVVSDELELLNLPSHGYILGFGLGGKRKGTEIAFKAYSLYRQNGGTLPLVLIGGKNLDLAAMGLNPADPPKVLGRVNDRTRDALYAGAACLLFFSRCEGFGYPMVEAARQGCPSVAWSKTTALEIFEDTIPLMQHLSSREGADLIRHYAALPADQRSILGHRLISRSEAFRNKQFGRDFVRAIETAVRRTKNLNAHH